MTGLGHCTSCGWSKVALTIKCLRGRARKAMMPSEPSGANLFRWIACSQLVPLLVQLRKTLMLIATASAHVVRVHHVRRPRTVLVGPFVGRNPGMQTLGRHCDRKRGNARQTRPTASARLTQCIAQSQLYWGMWVPHPWARSDRTGSSTHRARPRCAARREQALTSKPGAPGQ